MPSIRQPNQTEHTLCVAVPHAQMENLTLRVILAAVFPFFSSFFFSPKNEKKKKKASLGSPCLQRPAAFILTITTFNIRTRTSGEENSNLHIRKTSCICLFSRLMNPDFGNWLYWLALNSCIFPCDTSEDARAAKFRPQKRSIHE